MSPDLERRSVVELRADRPEDCRLRRRLRHALAGPRRLRRSRQAAGRRPRRSRRCDIVALYNHDAGAVLGRTPKTLTLTKDTRGLAFSSTRRRPRPAGMRSRWCSRGDVTGAQLRLSDEEGRLAAGAGVMVRELLDIEIAEISLTAFPAYRETDVSVAQRSLRIFTAQQGQRIDWLRQRLITGRT